MIKKAAVGAATLVAALGAGGTAWAVESSATAPSAAASTTATTTGPAAPKPAGRAGRLGGLLDRADHGTLEIRTKTGWETVDYDRGKVTASSASSITLLRPDGQSVTEAITSTTKYHGPGTKAVVGQPARIISLNGTALTIGQGGGPGAGPGGTKAGGHGPGRGPGANNNTGTNPAPGDASAGASASA